MKAKQSKECLVHSFQRHGREAEELRTGLEKILGEMDVGEMSGAEAREAYRDLQRALYRLLDGVDARDSLAYLERNPKRRTTHTKGKA